MRTWQRLAGAVAAALAVTVAGGAPAAAQAGERIRDYAVEIDVRRSGRILVTERIEYDFGRALRHGIYRDIPVRFHHDEHNDRVYPLADIEVTGSPGTPTDVETETSGGVKRIRIGDPDREITGRHRYVIRYEVRGAIDRFESHDELYWNAIGVHWDVPIGEASAVVRVEGEGGEVRKVTCFAGPEGSRLACDEAAAGGSGAQFRQHGLSTNEGLTIVVALPAGYAAEVGPLLRERWRVDKAFAPTPQALTGAGVLLLLAGVGVGRLVGLRGRDRRFAGEVPGLVPPPGAPATEALAPVFGDRAGPIEYAPPDGLRPALMGVLVDESANPLDVTATIVDLAVRRHLRIEELPRQGLFRRRDWRLVQLDSPPDDRLEDWEQTLLNALFRGRNEVELSDLKTTFHHDLNRVQDRLYDDVVRRGWFTRRPDHERGRWFAAGVGLTLLGAGVTALLAWKTTYGLLGLPVVAAGLLLLALHHRMPFRTARGSAALARTLGFRRYLATAEREQLRFEESEGVFARYLPYAVVFGETERWAKAFAGLGERAQQELYWYHGPSGWSLGDFSDSLGDFSSATAGALAATPASSGGSGFSGGSSGGGGGGGGGGSW